MKKIGWILIVSLFLSGCDLIGDQQQPLVQLEKENQAKGQEKISSDLKTLRKLIKLPYEPKQIWWKSTPVGEQNQQSRLSIGPTDYTYEIILLFDSQAMKEIMSKGCAKPVEFVSPRQLKNLISKELTEAWKGNLQSDKKDIAVCSPDLFYPNGRLYILSNHTVYLSLFTT
jgi:hypothetical protein